MTSARESRSLIPEMPPKLRNQIKNQIKIYIAPYVHEDSEALGGWITSGPDLAGGGPGAQP